MKKFIFVISMIIIFICAVFVGNYIYKVNYRNETSTVQNTYTNKALNENIVNNISTEVDSIEEKISPNANLILKKKYTKCGHTIEENVEIPKEFVNLTQKELEESYAEWKVEEFSPLNIILTKDENAFCNEHYILKSEDDGVVSIYKIDENGEETFYETTEIYTEYLTENDKIELENGLRVFGKENLNSILEDFE